MNGAEKGILLLAARHLSQWRPDDGRCTALFSVTRLRRSSSAGPFWRRQQWLSDGIEGQSDDGFARSTPKLSDGALKRTVGERGRQPYWGRDARRLMPLFAAAADESHRRFGIVRRRGNEEAREERYASRRVPGRRLGQYTHRDQLSQAPR